MNILVTGGTGFIGSHTVVELINNGHEPIIVDNLSNSKGVVIEKIEKITGKKIKLYKTDIRDKAGIEKIFTENEIDVVIHFAGLKAVGESVAKPLYYYDNNITGTLVLLDVMKKHSVRKIIFSSSATVYGIPEKCPIDELHGLSPINPYGRTKYFIEEILKDTVVSDREWSVVLLRYFNPVGAHESGEIGEDPQGIPNNLVPYLAKVAMGTLKELSVFGNDYPTKDGTGVRDYIHVKDLAEGHVCALKKVSETGVFTYNLGTGVGYSVLEMVEAYKKVSGNDVPYKFAERRAGDAAECFADPSLAEREIGFKAKLGLYEMCRDSWMFQQKNPDGYKS